MLRRILPCGALLLVAAFAACSSSTTGTTGTESSSNVSSSSSGKTTTATSSSSSSGLGGSPSSSSSSGFGGLGGSVTVTGSSSSSSSGIGGGGTTTATSSSSSGGGGSDSGSGPTNVSCATAAQYTLTLDAAPTVINGTTVNAANNFSTACSGQIANAGAVVYEVTVPAEASFTMTLDVAPGSTLQPAIAVRTKACATDDSPPYCFDLPMGNDAGASETVAMDLPAGNYWFIVGGTGGTSGAFTITAQATTPKCGDGIVNSGEQCDEGPNTPLPWTGTGCNPPPGSAAAPECQFTTNNNQACPGLAFAIPAGATNVLAASGNTTGYKDNYSEDCSAQGLGVVGMGAPDRTYVLTPAAAGTLTVTVGNDTGNMTAFCDESNNMSTVDCWEFALYARSTCTDDTSGALLACAQPLTGAASISFPVKALTPYYVIVDGLTNDMFSYGYYNLYVTLQ